MVKIEHPFRCQVQFISTGPVIKFFHCSFYLCLYAPAFRFKIKRTVLKNNGGLGLSRFILTMGVFPTRWSMSGAMFMIAEDDFSVLIPI